MEFETDAPTDDLGCVLSDGTRIDLSAKRQCSLDGQFRKTVKQWKAQVDDLGPGDRLGLVVAEPSSTIMDLGEALRRRRAGTSVYSAGQRSALHTFKGLLTDLSEEQVSRILDAAHILKVHAGEVGNPESELAAARLANVLVPADAGQRAFDALYKLMQVDAGKAYASDVGVWLNTLDRAGLELFRDLRGPIGVAVRAQQVAVAAHRQRLRDADGLVELSLLAEDLPPLRVAGLADGLRGEVVDPDGRREKVKLLHLARRWRCLLLVGLPGMGKTTAVRQIAARWARDDDAPVPVIVPLRRLAQRCPHAAVVTLSVLCEIAAEEAPGDERESLARALEQLCRDGRAALFADGMDECGARRGVIAQGLAAVVATLPAETGVLVTTRAYALPAAGQLDFPQAELTTPDGLDDVLEQVLQHVAARRIDADLLSDWLHSRKQWLRRTRANHRDFGNVPLLATILALVIAEEGEVPLPAGPARLLRRAVTNSVQRWEQLRDMAADPGQIEQSRQRLLDGFAALGRLLSVSGGAVPATAAQAAVVKMLTSPRWNLAEGQAEEAAEAVLWFWDQRVGVFVRTRAGIAARSRVFTEIAVAMGTWLLDADALTAWVTTALHDVHHHQGLILAAELDANVRALVVNASGDTAAALFAAKAARAGAEFTPQQLSQLMENLATAGAEYTGDYHTTTGRSPANQEQRDGPGWLPWPSLAGLRLPAQLRARRDELLAGVRLDPERATLLAGLAALADADADQRHLSPAETDAVRNLLRLDRPDPPGVAVHDADGVLTFVREGFLLTGHVDGAFDAVQHLPELGLEPANHIRTISGWADWRESLELERRLRGYGVPVDPSALERSLASLAALSAPILQADRERPLLEAVAGLSDAPPTASLTRQWRYDDLAHLLASARAEHVSVTDFGNAVGVDNDETRRGWFAALAAASGLNRADVAAQARRALTECASEAVMGDVWELLTTPMPDAQPDTDATRLTTADQTALVVALDAASDWITEVACRILLGITDDALSTLLMTRLADYPPRRRYQVAQLACRCSSDPAATVTRLLAVTDPIQRVAGARVLRTLDRDLPAVAALQDAAAQDPDLTVRHAVHQNELPAVTGTPASRWSCLACVTDQPLSATRCPNCRRHQPPIP
ncbi:NACHT domain-containing protein [Micromonospora sp. NPDC023814]|uniref:NACHT domain-containing protein n=1 Tax=Micromonospora sp. NPDC023814 TaxID=3154596 RepID=UPI0033CF5B8F